MIRPSCYKHKFICYGNPTAEDPVGDVEVDEPTYIGTVPSIPAWPSHFRCKLNGDADKMKLWAKQQLSKKFGLGRAALQNIVDGNTGAGDTILMGAGALRTVTVFFRSGDDKLGKHVAGYRGPGNTGNSATFNYLTATGSGSESLNPDATGCYQSILNFSGTNTISSTGTYTSGEMPTWPIPFTCSDPPDPGELASNHKSTRTYHEAADYDSNCGDKPDPDESCVSWTIAKDYSDDDPSDNRKITMSTPFTASAVDTYRLNRAEYELEEATWNMSMAALQNGANDSSTPAGWYNPNFTGALSNWGTRRYHLGEMFVAICGLPKGSYTVKIPLRKRTHVGARVVHADGHDYIDHAYGDWAETTPLAVSFTVSQCGELRISNVIQLPHKKGWDYEMGWVEDNYCAGSPYPDFPIAWYPGPAIIRA